MRKDPSGFHAPSEPVARQLPAAAYLRLKAAFRKLVNLCGGLEAAAAETRVGKSALHEYGQVEHASFPPADVVADLEAFAGRSPVTEALKALAAEGAVPTAPRRMTAADAIGAASDSLSAVGAFARNLADAAGDGEITPAEITRLITLADRLANEVQRIRDDLVAASAAANWTADEYTPPGTAKVTEMRSR